MTKITPAPDQTQNAFFSLIKLIARQSAVYGLFDLLGRATAIILVPLYVNKLSPQDFGMLEILLISQTLILGLIMLGFNSALVRFYTTAENPQEAAGYFRTTFTLVSTVALFIVLILIGAAPLVSRLTLGSPGFSNLWTIVFLTVLSDTLVQIFLSLYRSQDKPFRYSWVNLLRFVVTLILNTILVGFLNTGVTGAIVGNLAGSVVALALSVFFSHRLIRPEIDRAKLSRLASFGLPIMIHPVAMFVMNNSDRYFLKMYHGVREVGIYALGYKIGLILSLLMNAFLVAWQPMVYRIGRQEGSKEIFARVLTYYLLVSGFVVLLISSFSHEIVGLISRPEYHHAAGFVWLILVSYLLQGVYYIFSTGITVTDRVKWFSIIIVLGAAVNIAFNLLLIPRFAMRGAAWATLASFLAISLGMLVVSQRYFPIRYEFRRAGILVFIIAAAIALNSLVIGHRSIISSGVKLLVVLSLPLVLHVIRFFSPEETLRFRLLVGRLLARAGADGGDRERPR